MMMHGNKAPSELRHTIPLKCKLTVSTQNSILDPRSFRESRIEFQGSSFEFWFSRFENQVSRIEFTNNHTRNTGMLWNFSQLQLLESSKKCGYFSVLLGQNSLICLYFVTWCLKTEDINILSRKKEIFMTLLRVNEYFVMRIVTKHNWFQWYQSTNGLRAALMC